MCLTMSGCSIVARFMTSLVPSVEALLTIRISKKGYCWATSFFISCSSNESQSWVIITTENDGSLVLSFLKPKCRALSVFSGIGT